MKATLEKLWDETVRMERVIFLAGALAAGDSMPDDLEKFFNDEDTETIEKCLGQIPEWLDLEAIRQRTEGIFEWLSSEEKLGFLVKFATPVMKVYAENSRSFSWGYYKIKWIYAETIDEAVGKGLAWTNECRAIEDAAFGKEDGAKNG